MTEENRKTFRLINRISKTFSFVIYNFAYAATLLFRISSKIILTFIPSFMIKPLLVLNIKRVRLIISQVKLITKITQTINIRAIRLVASTKATVKDIIVIYLRMRISFISSAKQKLITNLLIKKITLTIVPTIAQFFSLGFYDPSPLLNLDPITLGNLDFTIV